MLSQLTSLLGLTQTSQTPDARKGDRPDIDFASVFAHVEDEKRASPDDLDAMAGKEELDPAVTVEEDDADPVAVAGSDDDDPIGTASAEDGDLADITTERRADYASGPTAARRQGAAEFGEAFPATALENLFVPPGNRLASAMSHGGEGRVPEAARPPDAAGSKGPQTGVDGGSFLSAGPGGQARIAEGQPPASRAWAALSTELPLEQTPLSVSRNRMASGAIDAPVIPPRAVSFAATMERTDDGQKQLAGISATDTQPSAPGAETGKIRAEGAPASVSGSDRLPGHHGDARAAVAPDMPIFRLGHLSGNSALPGPARKNVLVASEAMASAKMASGASDTLQPDVGMKAAVGPDADSSLRRNAIEGFGATGSERRDAQATLIGATAAGRPPFTASPHSAPPGMMPEGGRMNGAAHQPTLPTGSSGLTSSPVAGTSSDPKAPPVRSSPLQRSEGTGAASGIMTGPGAPASRAASPAVVPGPIATEAALMSGTARVTSPLLADLLDDPVGADVHGAGHSSEARLMSGPSMATPNAAPRADAAATLRQVAEGMARLADGTVDIRLSPDELGQVRMQLAPSETGLTVHIMADRPETLDLLRRHIDQLARDLAEAGYDGASFTFGDGDGQDDGQPTAHQGAAATAAPDDQPAPEPRAEMPGSDGLDLRM